MSLLRKIQGLIAEGASLTGIAPLFVGGKNCSGNATPLPICDTVPNESSNALFISARPPKVFRDSFSGTISANGINSNWSIIARGAGQTVAQSSGNLVLGAGTTANEEIILRSVMSWDDAFVSRWIMTLSQRIADNNTVIEFVDVIGDDLAITSSGTALSITKSNHGFTSENVGQSLFIGAFKNVVGGTAIPGQWAIASITNANTFVVTATGSTGTISSGTCSVWGWNSIRALYFGTSATAWHKNSTRNGWNTGADASMTATTTASGQNVTMANEDGICTYNDAGINSSSVNGRGVISSALPSTDKELFLQIRITNGTTNPASGTTVTIGGIAVEDIASLPTKDYTNRGIANILTSIPVNVLAMPTTSVTQTSPSTSANGVTTFGLINSANTTNTTSQKSSAGAITSIQLFNNGASPAYFKLYNKSSAPTLASDTPILILGIGAGQSREIAFTHQLRLGTGIAYAITGGAANTDTTAVAANQVTGGIQYA